MTKEEIEKIKEHIEIHARHEPFAIRITEIMRKAVVELEHIAKLEAQIEKMKCCGNCKNYQFQNDAGYYTCTRDGKCNGKNYRSCEFNLEKWEGR